MAKPLVTSVEVETKGNHSLVKVWVHHQSVGALLCANEDAEPLCALLIPQPRDFTPSLDTVRALLNALRGAPAHVRAYGFDRIDRLLTGAPMPPLSPEMVEPLQARIQRITRRINDGLAEDLNNALARRGITLDAMNAAKDGTIEVHGTIGVRDALEAVQLATAESFRQAVGLDEYEQTLGDAIDTYEQTKRAGEGD
jgi:hypothetical protein